MGFTPVARLTDPAAALPQTAGDAALEQFVAVWNVAPLRKLAEPKDPAVNAVSADPSPSTISTAFPFLRIAGKLEVVPPRFMRVHPVFALFVTVQSPSVAEQR